MGLLKLFDTLVNIGASFDLLGPAGNTVRGFSKGVYFSNDGTSAADAQDYLKANGINASIETSVGHEVYVAVRAEDERLAKSLLSRKRGR